MEKSFKEKQAHLKELFNNFNEDQLNNLFSPENVVSAAYDSAFRQTLSNLAERHASGSEMDDYFKSIFIEKKIDTAKHLNVELTEKETMVDEVNTAYNTKQINKYLANENPPGVFEAKKFAKTSLSLIKNNGKEDINYVTINGEGKEENSFTLKPGETGILAQNDYGAEKVNAWKIDLDSARKLYGDDAINSLTVQNIENELNDSKIKNLEHSEFSKIGTSQMIQITADIISQLNLRVNGDRGIQFNSKDGTTNIIDENAYIVNYTGGEIYPLSKEDFNQTYEIVNPEDTPKEIVAELDKYTPNFLNVTLDELFSDFKPLDIANNINQSKHNEGKYNPLDIANNINQSKHNEGKYNPLDIANTERSQGIESPKTLANYEYTQNNNFPFLNVQLDELAKALDIANTKRSQGIESPKYEPKTNTLNKEILKKEVEISTKVQDTSPDTITKNNSPDTIKNKGPGLGGLGN